MAEPPAAAPAVVAASERGVLLATKLHVPRPQPGFVSRPRLAGALDEGLARGLVLICAPAGFGKTALVANWAWSGDRPVGWLSLDEGDNDPARFWRHAVAALDRAHPGIAERVGPVLGPPAPSSFEGLVTALVNELADRPGDSGVQLVLDDYHLISSQPVHTSLTFLVEHLPPGLRLVLASRSDPPLPLARLRAGGKLAELRADELRFTAEESAALLREAAGAALPGDAVTALAARTEGWAAGLQLAALSMRGQLDPAGFVAAFSGSHRYVLDYLAQEVLDRQGEQMRGFLLETSVLERLSGGLCDAVTGRTDSQAMLEAIEQAGLFLVPLDEVRGWWRYHHLFAGLLRARLRQQQPGQVAALHHNAAAWYAERGLADDAIRHATAAGEMLWAARLIEQHFDAAFHLRGEEATIQRWISVLPADLVGSRPRLLLAQAFLAVHGGRVEEVEQLLDVAGRAPAGAADEPFEPTAGRAASLLGNVAALDALHRGYLAYRRGDAEGTAASASRALAQLTDEDQALRRIVDWYLGVAEWLRGRLAEAERGYVSRVSGWRAAGLLTSAVWNGYDLAQVQRGLGRLDSVVRTCQQMLEMTAGPGRPFPAAAGPAHVGLAEVAYQRNELDFALQEVTKGIALCRQFAYTPPLAGGLVTLAWIRQATGDPVGALDAIGEAERASPGPSALLNPVPAERARLLLSQGDVVAAAEWIEECGLSPDDEPGYPQEMAYLVLARVLLAQGRPGEALALLEGLRAAATRQDRTGSIIEIQALEALALAATGREADAVDALAEALTLACPQGYVRVFADEGAPMGTLLTRLIAAQRGEQGTRRAVELGCLARLLAAVGGRNTAHGQSSAAAVAGLVEPLTARELEILHLLAAGTPNQAIARQLVVSLDTVKKHVSHVLGKLGAANRTEAVTRARQLDLIR